MSDNGHASVSLSACAICFQKNLQFFMLRYSILLESLLELSCSLFCDLAAPSGSSPNGYGTVSGNKKRRRRERPAPEEEEEEGRSAQRQGRRRERSALEEEEGGG